MYSANIDPQYIREDDLETINTISAEFNPIHKGDQYLLSYPATVCCD